MLVLVNLDIFAQFLAAWHTNIEPHKRVKNTNTHTRKKTPFPQHILQAHRTHIQNRKSKQKHIFKRFTVLPEQPVAAVF
jgi:hypothetical protein